MKKLNLVYGLFIAVLILTSCSSDDSDSNNTSASIIGKWQLTDANYGGTPIELTACELEQTMEFFANGTAENYYEDNGACNYSTITVDYSKNGNSLSFSIDGEGIGGGTYVLNATVEVLTETTLRYKYISDNEVGTYPTSEQYTETYVRIE